MDASSTSQQPHRSPQIPPSRNSAEKILESNKIYLHRLGIAGVVLGSSSILIGALTAIFSRTNAGGYQHWNWRHNGPRVSEIGAGIWCGATSIISSMVGVAVRTQRTGGWYIANVVMSILSLLSMLSLLILSSIAAMSDSKQFAQICHVILAVLAVGGCVVAILHTCFAYSLLSCGGNQQEHVIYSAVPQSQMVPVQMPYGRIMYYPPYAFHQPIALHPDFQTHPMAFVSPNPAMPPASSGQLTRSRVLPQTASQNTAPVNTLNISVSEVPVKSASLTAKSEISGLLQQESR